MSQARGYTSPNNMIKKIIGGMFIAFGVIANPWFLGIIFTPYGPITKEDLVFVILLFDLCFVIFGIVVWRYGGTLHALGRTLLVNGGIVILALAVCMTGLELVLRAGWFDDLDNPRPVWIPARYAAQNEHVNDINFGFSANNPYQFNDILRTKEKKPGRYRIAVLGDSFVWGDGLPYDEAWGHVLERELKAQYDTVEVMSWGKPGWTTKRELRFLKESGYEFSLDLLIISFVYNDLDLSISPPVFTWQNLLPFRIVSFIFPNAFGFIVSHTNAIVSATILHPYNYDLWTRSLYDEQHKETYRDTLAELLTFAKSHRIRLLMVLTPPSHELAYEEYHQQVIPLLKDAGIPYLDLYPEVSAQFASSSPRSLWSNPANAHPGSALTHLYSEAVISYIQEHTRELSFPAH